MMRLPSSKRTALAELELMGLHLSPANQKFMPNDFELMKPIYETCIKYDKPILFDSGMIWIKNAPTKYSQPILFEDVALEYPELRICSRPLRLAAVDNGNDDAPA